MSNAPPTFILNPAFTQTDIQLELRLVFFEVLVAVEDRKMFANNLFTLVLLVELRAHIPCNDVPVPIEKEDRVVLDSFYEDPKCLIR